MVPALRKWSALPARRASAPEFPALRRPSGGPVGDTASGVVPIGQYSYSLDRAPSQDGVLLGPDLHEHAVGPCVGISARPVVGRIPARTDRAVGLSEAPVGHVRDADAPSLGFTALRCSAGPPAGVARDWWRVSSNVARHS
ncbi:hypothetical protein ACFPM0_11420 [Pseudonocardia sulfidoxydans]|uniref:hypothetical protein n=1 Tax=Pseudonocardia sulfidoxydans TaxID=54011 RepID=UPI00360D2797